MSLNPILFKKFVSLTLVSGSILISTISFATISAGAGISKDRVIALTNEDRNNFGINTLTENEDLDIAAQEKAKAMLAQNSFEHFLPDGTTPWDKMTAAGYNFAYAGENLAMSWPTAESQNDAWMNSPDHRKNILNPVYRDIGVAVVEGELEGQKTTLVVQMFGEKLDEQNFVFEDLTTYISKLLGI